MSQRDFFRILIKVFGLYWLVVTLFSIAGNLYPLFRFSGLTSFVWFFLSILVTIGIFVGLIFYSDKIIFWLKLDQGYDAKELNVKDIREESIMHLAILLLGGFLFLKNLPPFLTKTFFAFKSTAPVNPFEGETIKYHSAEQYVGWITSFLYVLMGFLLLTNYKRVATYLKRIGDKNASQ